METSDIQTTRVGAHTSRVPQACQINGRYRNKFVKKLQKK